MPGGVTNLDELWLALAAGRDLVTEVPSDRFDRREFFSPGATRPGKTYTVAGGFLDDIAQFDAEYFGLSPKEASRVDPQHRLLLECAAEAFDDAAIDPAMLAGSDTAVYMGISTRDYSDMQLQHPRTYNAYNLAGGALNNAANRLSYFFDLRGPSIALDTACSSSLTAFHEACQTIRSGRSALALAGGVNVLLGPLNFVAASQASMLSPTGRCHPFSARADGFVRAEGAGVFVLKPLAAATADRDRIHGVVLGSATTCDGHTAGLAMPSQQAQAEMLRLAYSGAGIAPDDVAYIEAHGTGTKAGDPVECGALGEVLGRVRSCGELPIGSVKSTVGHLESAAGVAGVCKALLVLREHRIPRTLHSLPLTEAIDFAGLGLAPVTEDHSLPPRDRNIVGVNSFGFGGANAHVVLASPPARPAPPPADRRCRPVLVTARSAQALRMAAEAMADRLQATTREEFADVAYTSVRRTRHAHRYAVLASDGQQAATRLRLLAGGDPAPESASAVAMAGTRVGFVFAGNGSPWVGMGTELLDEDAAFAAEIDRIDTTIRPMLGWSVRAELTDPDPARWSRTDIAQPLLFAVQAGLVAALADRGIRPAAVCGHSVGEVAAAYCSGALDLAAACAVTVTRSSLQERTAGSGRMAAVGLDAERAEQELSAHPHAGRLVITATNSPTDVSVAGEGETLAAWGAALANRGVFFHDLNLPYAFHSAAMDGIREPLLEGLAPVRPTASAAGFYSTVTGELLAGDRLDAGYWWRNVREPVRFADAVSRMFDDGGCNVFVEIGPHPVLSTYLRRICAGRGGVAVVASMSRTHAGTAALNTTVAATLASGGNVDARGYFGAESAVSTLPGYPWQKRVHWSGAPHWWSAAGASDDPDRTGNPLLGGRLATSDAVWQQQIDTGRLAWLPDHRVAGAVVMPAAAFVDAALSAGNARWDSPVEIREFTIDSPLTLPLDDPAMDVLLSTRISDGDGRLTISSRAGEQHLWTTHIRCRVRVSTDERPLLRDLASLRDRLPRRVAGREHYDHCERLGLSYGPAFQTLTDIHVGDGEVLAQFRATNPTTEGHAVHPTVLDGAFQAAITVLAGTSGDDVAYLPSSIGQVRSLHRVPDSGFIHIWGLTVRGLDAELNIAIGDADGRVALDVRRLTARRFEGAVTRIPRMVEKLQPEALPGAALSPSPFAPAAITAAATDLAALAGQWREARYGRFRHYLMALTAHFLAAALTDLLAGATSFTLDDLRAVDVRDHHVRNIAALLPIAAEHGTARRENDSWRLTDGPRPTEVFASAITEIPSGGPVFQAHRTLFSQLAGLLRGEVDALELILSGTDPVGPVIYESAHVGYQYQIARALLRHSIADWPADRPLRVLEVGAGTGAATAALLRELPSDRTVYWYTDLSPAFFPAARNRFRDHDFLHFRKLDLNADPVDQGLPSRSFDLAVAFDVLHATSDLRAALARIGSLLADDGRLLAIEETCLPRVASVFGWLESFWSIGDPALRPDGPILGRREWTNLLEECGYRDVTHAGDDEDPGRGDFSVMLAARTPRPASTGEEPITAGDGRRWLIAGIDGGASTARLTHSLSGLLEQRHPGAVRRLTAGHEFAGARTWLADGDAQDVVLVVDGDLEVAPSELAARAAEHCIWLRDAASLFDASPDGRTLWILVHTTGQAGPATPPVAGPAAALWGAARTLANERPSIAVRRLGLTCSDTDPSDVLTSLRELMISRSPEDEVVVTAGGRFVSRLRTRRPPTASGSGSSYILVAQTHGPAYELAWRRCERPRPADGELLIDVRAAALNYRDVMTVMGHVPPFPPRNPAGGPIPLGHECAGVVAAVGSGVTGFSVGDRVMVPTVNSLTSHAQAIADRAIPIPDGMTFDEAATLPLAYFTVVQSLEFTARLTAGETLLIHGAAGGVGLAAVRVATDIGATVIATAGTPAKRDLLKTLGVSHVFDSRSMSFAEQVRECTGGDGVDVVLNSLAGEGLVRSLELVKPHGRFIEIGKRDILADNPLPLSAFGANITFASIDLHAALQAPEVTRRIRDAVRDGIRSGRYRPLPYHLVAARDVRDGFALLQQSRHIGKVVIGLGEPPDVAPAVAALALRPDRTYLVTGGTSGVGAATAITLAEHGARHVALVSRRGRHAPEAAAVIDGLGRRGAEVQVYAADATDPAAMTEVIAAIEDSGYPLGGLVHAAMVLDDAPLADLSAERMRAVLAPKMQAATVLDLLSRDKELDFFLVYSSVSALTGNVLQASYVGGNLAMEALVRQRRAVGLPGQAIQLGPVADAGFVERSNLADHLARTGLGRITVDDVMAAVVGVLADPTIDVVSATNADWPEMALHLPMLGAPRTAHLVDTTRPAPSAERVRDTLARLSSEEATAHVEGVLVDLLAGVMHSTPEQIDTTRKLDQIGVESLMASELAALIRARLDCVIPVLELTSAANVQAIAHRICSRLRSGSTRQPVTPSPVQGR